jgi:hypothetical protein
MTQMLLDHFKRMQEMATSYLTPEPYTTMIPGATPVTHDDDDTEARTELFVNDILYMLDGPEQRDAQARAELVVSQGYPTLDAYMGAMRALHWRTAQLRQAGIEPISLLEFPGAPERIPHYPPDHFRFPITQAFPGDEHRQIYHAWRRFPRAMWLSIFFGLALGATLGVFAAMVACNWG